MKNNNTEVDTLNQIIRKFKYKYSQHGQCQTLEIDGHKPLFFYENVRGTIAGGSSKWIRKKHKRNWFALKPKIHEPGTIASLIYFSKHYEKKINNIFDIGALYGYFSLISKSFFPASKVMGFEMNPDSYNAFNKNISFNAHLNNPAIECFNIGLSDNTEYKKTVHIDEFRLDEDSQSNSPFIIDIVKLDDFCKEKNVYPDLIKIDVEGYQARVIPGALDSIDKSKPFIILELDKQSTLKRFHTTNKLVIKPLFEMGYKCFWNHNHRSKKGYFEDLVYCDMSNLHETNSLVVLLHPSRQ